MAARPYREHMLREPFTAETNAGSIAGSVAGSGPTLLLLHGGPGLTDYLDLLEPELTGWRTVRYQQRGLPPSTTDGPFTVERNVADAVAVLNELQTGPVFVLGHSWGGFLALQLAVARLDPLGVVGDGGMAELDRGLTGRLTPAAADEFAAVAARLSGPGVTHRDEVAGLALLWPGYFADPASAPPPPDGLDVSAQVNEETVGSAMASIEGGFAGRLGAVTAPAVFVLGEQSPLPPALAGQPTAGAMPRAEVALIPAAGHLPWHEQPGCVAAALDRVRTLASPPASD
jgi:pimeloyl-ACP methyl ester carboxylesterase